MRNPIISDDISYHYCASYLSPAQQLWGVVAIMPQVRGPFVNLRIDHRFSNTLPGRLTRVHGAESTARHYLPYKPGLSGHFLLRLHTTGTPRSSCLAFCF